MPDERRDDELPLDELRRAWAQVEPPRSAVELEEADPTTRAAVAWMQAAWGSVQAPAPVLPLAPRRRGWRRWAQPLAAAAGVLVALGAGYALQRLQPGMRPQGVDTPITAQSPGQGPTVVPQPDDGVQLAALAPDRVELRSGPVRLILLTGEDSPQNN